MCRCKVTLQATVNAKIKIQNVFFFLIKKLQRTKTHTQTEGEKKKKKKQQPVKREKKKKRVIPPGIEPGTLSVLDSRDNRYTTESLRYEPTNISCFVISTNVRPALCSLILRNKNACS